MHSDKNVDNIDKVKGVVNDVPTNGEVFSHFPEDGSTHHKNDLGGFQLLDLIITELKSHMTCYNSTSLIGWNTSIQTGEQIL